MRNDWTFAALACGLMLAALAFLPASRAQSSFQTKIHGADNGNSLVIESGGALKVPASGTAGTGVTITATPSEFGLRKVVLNFASVSIATTDQGSAGAQGSKLIYTFPAGKYGQMLGASVNLTTLAGSGGIVDGAALVGAVGVTAAGTGDATLTSLEATAVPSIAGTLTSGAGTLVGVNGSTAMLGAAIDDLYLNLAVPNADSSADDTVTVNGTITLWFLELP